MIILCINNDYFQNKGRIFADNNFITYNTQYCKELIAIIYTFIASVVITYNRILQGRHLVSLSSIVSQYQAFTKGYRVQMYRLQQC